MAYSPGQNKIQHFEEACQEWDIERLADDLVGKTGDLPPAQQRNLKAILLNLSPKEAAKQLEISESTLKPAFSALYRLIENLTQEKSNTVTYKTARFVLENYRKKEISPKILSIHSNSEILRLNSDRPQLSTNQIASEDIQKFRLIGRDEAITKLNELFKVHKIVLVLGEGGLGKSALAKFYCGSKVCEFHQLGNEEIAKAESLVDGWLQGLFGEAPSNQEFRIKLDRLRKYLIEDNRGICIVLDNLEPALNDGKFKEEHRRYVALLEVLSDPRVSSVTLITSRQPIHENVEVFEYKLPELDNKSWCEYFQLRKIEVGENHLGDVNSALNQMHRDYGGNAECMCVLSGNITNAREHKMNLEAYWERNKEDLRAHPRIEGLIKWQFDVLEHENPLAYKLLCRMGCYRYQDAVATVPEQGLLDLLWDEATTKPRRVVDNLFNRCLIKFSEKDRGYFLHPVMREEAVSRLKDRNGKWTEEGKDVNILAAKFFDSTLQRILTVTDALQGFEIIFHYLEAENYEAAASMLLEAKNSAEYDSEVFGYACWRLGFSQKVISTISTVLEKVDSQMTNPYILAGLYRTLGYSQNQLGNIHEGIKYHELSQQISNKYFQSIEFDSQNIDHLRMGNMICAYFVNVGLCYIDLWDISKAQDSFEKANIFFNRYDPFSYSWATIQSCLTLVKSILSRYDKTLLKDAYRLANDTYSRYHAGTLSTSTWGETYSPFLLGKAFNFLDNIERALEMYHIALSISSENGYTQAKANILCGLAEVYKKLQNFNVAFSYHHDGIGILQYLGAKCDLAEAYFQLGLTYQAMGEHDQAKEYKAKALQLFAQMEAPKQIERVNKAFDQGAIK
ncbi:ATP-binding protein [Pseudanabaena sp. ABRG5-3]|uniref:ATP-binding protein n=1 Tax=Pseudanabaena sp. ABRG5-3 TaxID=685565 RepID=UPI000F81C2ED|nr:tetratricopeptide repeat protein [Pseudanabaena sp. ABRG5-3]